MLACSTVHSKPIMRRTLLLVLAALAVSAQQDQYAPLLGTWEGDWKVMRGVEEIAGRFRFTFTAAAGGVEGRYNNLDYTVTRLDGKPSKPKQKLSQREFKVDKLQVVSPDPPRYRWVAAGDCWNVDIKADGMEGYFNAGACTGMGMGAGAMTVEFTAKKAR